MSASSLASPELVSADFLPPLTVVRGRGRPSSYSPETLAVACGLIREQGLTDTEAGALVGIPKATLSRWKAADEEIALALQRARAEHAVKLIREVRDACDRGGRPQWRAAAWLLARMHPEEYGTPAQKEKARALREREEEQERREYEKWVNGSKNPDAEWSEDAAENENGRFSSKNAAAATAGEATESEEARFRSKNASPNPEELEVFRSTSLKMTGRCGAGAPGGADREKGCFSSENAVAATDGGATESEKVRFRSKNAFPPSPGDEEEENLEIRNSGRAGGGTFS